MNTLNSLMDRAVQEGGEKVAYVIGDRRVTYSAVYQDVLSIAEGLRAEGVKKGDRVAIVHRNAPEFVVAYFALSRLGAIAVPINFLVTKPDDLAYMLRDSGALGVFTQEEFLPGLLAAVEKCPTLKALWVTDQSPEEISHPIVKEFASLRRPAPEQYGQDAAIDTDVAAILYTSGTTGFPKGVMLTHRNLVSNCESSIKRILLTRKDVLLCILPMFHSFAWTALVLTSLRLTLKCVISPSIAPPKPWLKSMGAEGVTLFAAVPQVYAALAREARDFKTRWFLKLYSFRKVRIGVSGAAPLAVATAQAFKDAVGVSIIEGWGLTETSPVATVTPLEDIRFGAVGTPIDGVFLKIVDDDEKELAQGTEGEICVKGDNVMKGYWGLPDATAAAFTKDGWLKTGDVGDIDADGYLSIRDRKKDMIIVKGLKVFSAQVEAAIAENPNVEESAIIGIPDESGDETIKAFVVLKKGCMVDKTALMQFFREKLDAYKRPRDVEIVESLPKNALQKVLKRELRQRELDKQRVPVGKKGA
jgi:long-chain acyl-CoA synthetase